MAWHLAISECPIILSGEQILMKGNWESSEILAARAVFPLLGGPEGDAANHPGCCTQLPTALPLNHWIPTAVALRSSEATPFGLFSPPPDVQ